MKSKLNFITTCALKALLYEVSASPKPGLVDRYGSGAHTDMDYFTFVDSALSLQETFFDCAHAGAHFSGEDLTDLFKDLRPIGIAGEKKMYEATSGVNTHKGAIFSLGILCAAAGHLVCQDKVDLSVEALRDISMKMTYGLTGELETSASENMTSGERLYAEKGVLGIRGEVEAGFPSVMNYGLPALAEALENKEASKNDILVLVLIELLGHVEDTNVMSRYGEEGLKLVREKSRQVISNGGISTQRGWQLIHDMDEIFIEKNISPGGTADLLAVTLMFHFLCNDGLLKV